MKQIPRNTKPMKIDSWRNREHEQDKDGKYEDAKPTFFHKHVKTTTTYRMIFPQIDLETSRTALLQPRL